MRLDNIDIIESAYTLYIGKGDDASVYFLWDGYSRVYDFWTVNRVSVNGGHLSFAISPKEHIEEFTEGRFYVKVAKFNNVQEFKNWLMETYFAVLL
jgi:hypothetical protein